MGRTTVNLYKDKKWESYDTEDIDGDFCNTNYLYRKYYPHLPVESDPFKSSHIPIKHYPTYSRLLRDHKVAWYEKVCFRFFKNMSYFNSNDIPLLVKALELMNQEMNSTSKNFNTQMIKYLKGLKVKENTPIALGYSSSGFWGTDAEPVINSLKLKTDEEDDEESDLMVEIGDNLNLNPSDFGFDIFSDITSHEQIELALKKLE